MDGKALNEQIAAIYRKRARRYDITANLYYLLGFREWSQRRQAVEGLALRRGDTVVEVGCGTGLNFGLIQERVGPTGRIIGVDLTEAMLEQARLRVERAGWKNVELVQRDADEYIFPQGAAAVLSTYALSLIPDSDRVIERASRALQAGGRVVVLDLQIPDRMPPWLVSLLLPLVRPFAVSGEWLERRPWEMIRQAVRRYFEQSEWRELYLGIAYLAKGVKGSATQQPAGPVVRSQREERRA